MTEFWTNREVATLKRCYPALGRKMAEMLPRRSTRAIEAQAARHGLSAGCRAAHRRMLRLAHDYFSDRDARGLMAAQRRLVRCA